MVGRAKNEAAGQARLLVGGCSGRVVEGGLRSQSEPGSASQGYTVGESGDP